MKDMRNNKRVFTNDVLEDGTPLYYIVQGKEQLSGFKVDGGIQCSCCKTRVTPSVFEKHAGYASRRKPYENIFTPDHVSLKDIAQRRTSVVETSMLDIGGCAICSSHDFTKKPFDDKTVIICDQCEKEYIVGCSRGQKMANIKALPEGELCCCLPCRNVNNILEMVIGMEELKISEALYSSLTKKYEQDLDMNQMLDISWRLLKGGATTEDTVKLLSDALSIFHDHIKPINDPNNASFNLIQHMVFGHRFNGQDYGGMHCAILMVNSNVVAAALFRVFGDRTAEIPLVATKDEYELTGHLQLLVYCTRKLLEFLNVKNPSLLVAGHNHAGIIDFARTGTIDFGLGN